LIYFQSKYLAEKFNINSAKWKRWSREFLPPDPLGGLRSGYARQFNYREAFCVFLAGYLVGTLKFSVPEAKQILSDLDGWLKKQGFYALSDTAKKAQAIDFHTIFIVQLTGRTFGYVVQSSKDKTPFDCSSSTATIFDLAGNGSTEFHFDPVSMFSARMLLISNLYRFFLSCLHS
jgi:hypothetical protein